MDGLQLKDYGEFGLIDLIDLPLYQPDEVIVAIGDDCAVLPYHEDCYQIISCDLLTEGVHFIRGKITAEQLGHKAVAVSLSDIAAMGGWPVSILISLALPVDYTVEEWQSFYQGVQMICQRYQVNLIGGDTTASQGGLTVNVTALGIVRKEALHLRSDAQIGDLIFVTGPLGGSRAGLEMMFHPDLKLEKKFLTALEQAHYRPEPCCEEIMCLNEIFGTKLHALNDISDGLISECREIASASGKSLVLEQEKIPIHEGAAALNQLLHADSTFWALTGGEDYQLVGTVSAEGAEQLAAQYRNQTGKELHFIGFVREGAGVTVWNYGQEVFFHENGYDHFHQESQYDADTNKTASMYYDIESTNDYVRLLEERLAFLESQQEAQQFVRHDLKNHFTCIAGLAEIGDLEKIKAYLKDTCAFMQPQTTEIQYCAHPVLNILFNDKMRLAKEQHIDLEIYCDFVSLKDISDFDLCSMISNLLDNGLENAGNGDEAYIHFDILQSEENGITIQMVNSCVYVPQFADGCLITTKKDKAAHGMGMRNIQRLARKYHGQCIYHYDGKERSFQTKVIFSPNLEMIS